VQAMEANASELLIWAMKRSATDPEATASMTNPFFLFGPTLSDR